MFDLLDRITQVQPVPPLSIVTVTAVIAAVLVLWRRSWRVVRQAVTIAHEGGHALVAVLTGRRLRGIKLHSDTSGLTLTHGRYGGVGMTLALAAGYTAPSLLGLGGAALLAAGRLTLLLWLATALTVAMLVMVRNWFGALSLLVLYPETTWRQARWEAAMPPLMLGVGSLGMMALITSWIAHRISRFVSPSKTT